MTKSRRNNQGFDVTKRSTCRHEIRNIQRKFFLNKASTSKGRKGRFDASALEQWQKDLEMREKALKEKREALKEEREALKEKREALKEIREALKEKREALKEKREALKEKREALEKTLTVLKRNQRSIKACIKPPYISKPSMATPKTVESVWMTGSIAAHRTLIDATKTMCTSTEDLSKDEKYRSFYDDCCTAADDIFESACTNSHFLSLVSNDEVGCTAILQALLQQHSIYNKDILWLHQYNFADIVGMKIFHNTDQVYSQPRVFFEACLGTNSGYKECQLSAYINNFWYENYFHDEQWVFCLGIILKLDKDNKGGTFSVNGYYSMDDNGHAKLGVASIFNGTWEVDNITKLLITIRLFLSENEIPEPAIIDTSWLMRNVYIENKENENDMVYKVYDYRNRIDRIFRHYEYSLRHIPNCKIYFTSVPPTKKSNSNKNKVLTIIQYPYLAGSHIASHTGQIRCILTQLLSFHTSEPKYVFGDIRASNIIFQEQSACFIDFDYMGIDGVDTYPPGFSLDIDDGQRHSDVKESSSIMYTYHDSYSMAFVLNLFRPQQNKYDKVWKKIITLVEKDKLGDAINILNSLESDKFDLIQNEKIRKSIDLEDMHAGTGITPRKQLGLVRR